MNHVMMLLKRRFNVKTTLGVKCGVPFPVVTFSACFKRYWQHLLFDLDILKGRVDIKPFFEITNQLDVHFSRYCHRFLWVANYILTTSKSGVKNTYTCVSFFKQMWDEVLVAIRQSDMRKFEGLLEIAFQIFHADEGRKQLKSAGLLAYIKRAYWTQGTAEGFCVFSSFRPPVCL